MRGKTGAELLTSLKAEIGVSPNSTTNDARYLALLNNTQHFLSVEYDFSFLRRFFDVAIVAGNRYLNIPANLNLLRPIDVQVLWNRYWEPVHYGIGVEQYNAWNSDSGETSDPIQRWSEYGLSGNNAQFEIWPLPESAQTLRFIGQKIPATLTSLTTCDLDDLLLVYWCAADELVRLNQPDAQLKLAKARERLGRVRGVQRDEVQPVVFGKPRLPVASNKVAVFGGGGGGTNVSVDSISGSFPLIAGEVTGTVVFSATFTPANVVLTVRAPAGGDVIVATQVEGTISAAGFDFMLSAGPAASGYYLDYIATA